VRTLERTLVLASLSTRRHPRECCSMPSTTFSS